MRMARFVLLFREFQCDRIVSPAAISIGIPEKAIQINTIQIIPITQLFSQIFCFIVLHFDGIRFILPKQPRAVASGHMYCLYLF